MEVLAELELFAMDLTTRHCVNALQGLLETHTLAVYIQSVKQIQIAPPTKLALTPTVNLPAKRAIHANLLVNALYSIMLLIAHALQVTSEISERVVHQVLSLIILDITGYYSYN